MRDVKRHWKPQARWAKERFFPWKSCVRLTLAWSLETTCLERVGLQDFIWLGVKREKLAWEVSSPEKIRKWLIDRCSVMHRGYTDSRTLGSREDNTVCVVEILLPSLYQDVKQCCQTCEECQLCSKKMESSLPIMGEPIERIAMDVVGPMTKTRWGNLVVCDYATRYPEEIPLKKFTTLVVAEHLMWRHGIPREILMDQGTNFTTALLQELYKMLGVKAIKTILYHQQTDGLVEKFNQMPK